MDGMTAVATSIVTALNANSDLIALVNTNIYQGAAPPKLQDKFPYVLFAYASGGTMNDASYDAIDCEFLVTAVDKTSTGAKQIHALIESILKDKLLTYADSWHSYSTVRQTDFFTRNVIVQNTEYDQIGAFYRFRVTKAKG